MYMFNVDCSNSHSRFLFFWVSRNEPKTLAQLTLMCYCIQASIVPFRVIHVNKSKQNQFPL